MLESPPGISRRQMLLTLLAGASLTACSRSGLLKRSSRGSQLALCGADEVFILSAKHFPEIRKVWSWRATDSPEIPSALARAFRSTDDCKPVADGQQVLISSSSGAIALVDRKTRRALFHAPVANAHSIELLPHGRIAAAASVSETLPGNRLIIFDIASGRELASDPLLSAHGVVWDQARELLYALGNNELRAYHLSGDSGLFAMNLHFNIKLPDSNGHDLCPIPNTPLLFISTGKHCWYFNRDTRQIIPHDTLAATPNIKSYSVHPVTGQVAYIQAEGKHWWAEHVHFLNPKCELHLPGQRLYKARWF